MITIVLIEDEERDIKHIRNVLVPLKDLVDYELIAFQEIKAGLDYIHLHHVELILCDLEFTMMKPLSFLLTRSILLFLSL